MRYNLIADGTLSEESIGVVWTGGILMTVTVNFGPKLSQQLIATARVRGVDPATLVERLVGKGLASETTGPFVTPLRSPGRAAKRLLQRLNTEAPDDEEIIQQAQKSLDDVKRSLNEERGRSGAEPLF